MNRLTAYTMRRINLEEHQESGTLTLSRAELQSLKDLDISITPAVGEGGGYVLKPGSIVGAVEIDGLSVLIRPKIGIPQLLHLACYAIGKVRFRREDFYFSEEHALPDVLAMALAHQARRAFARGLLHGYRVEEEALHTVRGRIRFDEQIRRRFGIPLPVEVRYDDFTDDILMNQLVKTAAYRLVDMRLRSSKARIGMGWIAGMLDGVSLREFPPNDVPNVPFDRLNKHYTNVVELSRLILRHSAFQSSRGAVRASGFLVDMNVLFQEFVTVALREALGLSERTFGEHWISPLDEGNRLHLRPDLVWRDGSSCVFVGDAKYKNITDKTVPESDIYQMLAYVTALNLQGGMLIYAGEAENRVYRVRHTDKAIEVTSLDISGTLDEILTNVHGLGCKVRKLHQGTSSSLVAATASSRTVL